MYAIYLRKSRADMEAEARGILLQTARANVSNLAHVKRQVQHCNAVIYIDFLPRL